jgi:hypothetical protein
MRRVVVVVVVLGKGAEATPTTEQRDSRSLRLTLAKQALSWELQDDNFLR